MSGYQTSVDRFVDRFASDNLDVENIGNKAANLVRLGLAGVHVPRGFSVTTAAQRLHMSRVHGAFDFAAVFEGALSGDSASLADAERWRLAIVETPLAKAIVEEVNSACESLLAGSKGSLIARSSATIEDGENASFAGMFDSFAGICGLRELEKGIKQCWASGLNLRLFEYLRRSDHFREAPQFPQISVLVQGIVVAEKAGVAFSTHPVTRDHDVAVIEASWGLAEPLVSGRLTPDHFEVDKHTGEVLRQRLGTKREMLVIHNNRPVLLATPDAKRRELCLDADELQQILGWTKEIETVFGCPQDVEWTWKEGAFCAVQSRPISHL